jgi:hypothetical protein
LRYQDKFGGKEKLLKDVKDALIQQDILPYWHDHFLAVSFRPLTRVDVRRAFNIGAMKDDAVTKSYLDLGYSDDNARVLTDFTVKLRNNSAVSHKAVKLWTKFAIDRAVAVDRMLKDGLPQEAIDKALADTETAFSSSEVSAAYVRGDISRADLLLILQNHGVSGAGAEKVADKVSYRKTGHPAIKDYIVGTLDRDAARVEMTNDGIPSVAASRLLDESDRAIEHNHVLGCQRAIKRRYLTGDVDRQDTVNLLVNSGTTQQRATLLTQHWQCELHSTGKEIGAAKLCEWLSRGAIGPLDFTRRLEKIGYTAVDASMMLEDCLISVNVKRLSEAKKLAKEESALQQKSQAALAKQAALFQRNAAQIQRATEKAATTRANREKQLLSAAAKVEKKCDCDVYSSLVAVRENHQRIQREYGLTVDESLRVLVVAAETWNGGAIASYDENVSAIAETIASDVVEQATE